MIPRIKISTPRILVKYFPEANSFLLDCLPALKIGNIFPLGNSFVFHRTLVVIDKGIPGRYNDRDFDLNKRFRVREVF